MNEHSPQAVNEGDMADGVMAAQKCGMAHLWQAVTEQIADPEAMRVNVTMARTVVAAGRTCTRLLR
jgi:hypothetical protein